MACTCIHPELRRHVFCMRYSYKACYALRILQTVVVVQNPVLLRSSTSKRTYTVSGGEGALNSTQEIVWLGIMVLLTP